MKNCIIKNIIKELMSFAIPILTNELFLVNHNFKTLTSFLFSPFESIDKIYTIFQDTFNSSLKNKSLKLVFIPNISYLNDLYDFLKSEECSN